MLSVRVALVQIDASKAEPSRRDLLASIALASSTLLAAAPAQAGIFGDDATEVQAKYNTNTVRHIISPAKPEIPTVSSSREVNCDGRGQPKGAGGGAASAQAELDRADWQPETRAGVRPRAGRQAASQRLLGVSQCEAARRRKGSKDSRSACRLCGLCAGCHPLICEGSACP